MGLAFVSLLSLVLMFLLNNRAVKYVMTGVVLLVAAFSAFFGLMVGITGCFIGQIGVSLMSALLIVVSIILSVLGAKRSKLLSASYITSAAALVAGLSSAFFI